MVIRNQSLGHNRQRSADSNSEARTHSASDGIILDVINVDVLVYYIYRRTSAYVECVRKRLFDILLWPPKRVVRGVIDGRVRKLAHFIHSFSDYPSSS